MQLGELIQRVQSLYSSGIHSDDSRLTSRHIYNKLVSVRSAIIAPSIRSITENTSGAEQYIDCVELIEAKDSDCYDCNETDDCDILMSKHPMPVTFNKGQFKHVSSLDGNIVYSYTNHVQKRFKRFRKHTSNRPTYYIRNNFLFTDYMLGPRVIGVEGVFESPIDAYMYPSACDENRCLDVYEMEFPIAATKLETLVERAAVELVQEFSLGKEDVKNNSSDEIERKGLGYYGKPETNY